MMTDTDLFEPKFLTSRIIYSDTPIFTDINSRPEFNFWKWGGDSSLIVGESWGGFLIWGVEGGIF